MRIDLTDSIAGRPAARIRLFLRRAFGGNWDASYVAQTLRVDLAAAEAVIKELCRRRLIARARSFGRNVHWTNTIRGNAFANASAAKPLLRSSADIRLTEFLERVEEVERDPRFLYRVKRAVLFGSYLSAKERINDIDIVVRLAPKEVDKDRQQGLEERQVREAIERGRRFSSFVDELTWPQAFVLRFLKGGSRSLSLHLDEKVLERGPSKAIYPR